MFDFITASIPLWVAIILAILLSFAVLAILSLISGTDEEAYRYLIREQHQPTPPPEPIKLYKYVDANYRYKDIVRWEHVNDRLILKTKDGHTYNIEVDGSYSLFLTEPKKAQPEAKD